MKTSVILCTRTNSSRVPKKVFKKINGVPLVVHLINRLKKCGLDVIIAAPLEQKAEYEFLGEFGVNFYFGESDNPLARMYKAAKLFYVDNVIRVTHDKIFIDPNLMNWALKAFKSKDADYLYSSEFTPGSGFEVIRFSALEKAYTQFKSAEHISYAVKAATKNITHYDVPHEYRSNTCRFLLDYEEDFSLLELILSQKGNDCSLKQAIAYCGLNNWANKLNKLPLVTFYTCAYNADKYIAEAMSSILGQNVFDLSEYILIDDYSTDKTPETILHYTSCKGAGLRFYRNQQNLGLASSSNKALKLARGKYIMRLDADDYLVGREVVHSMLNHMVRHDFDVLYPDNYFGAFNVVQKAKESHHIGGALFKTSAINHVKFTDGLRGLEGLDFWHRAKDQLKVAYYDRPAFFYRQHEESLTKNNIIQRKELRETIESKYL